METFNSLEQLAHRLQEQIYGLREKIIPALEDKIANLNGSADNSDLTSQIDDLKNNVIPALDSKFATIESLQNVENDLGQLETDLTQVVNELDNELATIGLQVEDLTQNVIPALENKISSNQGSSSGGSSTASEWKVVYDKNSEDESLNWGYPDGIIGLEGTISKSVDFMPYSYMRIYYFASGTHSLHEFYIRDANDSDDFAPAFGFTYMYFNATALGSQVVSLARQDDGRMLFHTSYARLHNLRTSGYITITSVATNVNFHISRIEVK